MFRTEAKDGGEKSVQSLQSVRGKKPVCSQEGLQPVRSEESLRSEEPVRPQRLQSLRRRRGR